MISPKELKKLAKACREAGIKHYKCPEFEFTLTDDLPEPVTSNKPKVADNSPFKSDSLSEEDLLFWSVRNADEEANKAPAEG